jgi:hypothetical protein
MENLHILKIFVKDSKKTENRYNKNLFEFLNNNVEEIIDSNYYIRLVLIDESNINKFIKLGVKSTPALLDEEQQKTVTGVEQIIKYIVSKCENWEEEINTQCPAKKEKTFNEDNNINGSYEKNEDLRSYFMNEVMGDDTIEEPVDINKVKDYGDQYNKNRDKLLSRNVNTNKNIINNVKNNVNSNNSQSIENYTENKEASDLINSNNEITQTKKISSYMDDDPELKKFWENLEESSDYN